MRHSDIYMLYMRPVKMIEIPTWAKAFTLILLRSSAIFCGCRKICPIQKGSGPKFEKNNDR